MSELSQLTGIGPKRLKALGASGIQTLRDLVYHLPRRYVDRTRITPISSLVEGRDAFFPATIQSADVIGTRLVLNVADETGDIELIFFRGVHFLKQRLREGKRISIAGPVTYFRNFQIAHPEWEELGEDETPKGGLLPVYPMTEAMEESRVDHKMLQRAAIEVLDKFNFSDPLKPDERAFLNLRSEIDVLRSLHTPQTLDETYSALYEIKLRELWPLCLKREKSKRDRIGKGKVSPPQKEMEDRVRSVLPYKLTNGQEKSLNQIHEALARHAQFFGLLQGDVGSGKTVVALLAALRVMASGSQSAILVPTEILAQQHFRTISDLLEKSGLACALLTASTTPDERKKILEGLKNGSILLVMGTHSLISADVVFKDLRLIIIDEQHRFGVEQRATMTAKGIEPHVLLLSATPIPRTLAQSYYGDMEMIILSEKPPGRLPVKTRLVPSEKQSDMLEFLIKEVENGNQVYWVVPRIHASASPQTIDAASSSFPLKGDEKNSVPDNFENIGAVETTLKRLRAAGKWRVDAVHGKMSSADRENSLSAFRNGDCRVLVATTVIEVGVDVPAANIMVVEGADRFGLAQLHQLRGRTGRGQTQAWCFLLLSQSGMSEETVIRLKEFAATEDGFKIAELDLQQRGAGSLDGTRQSGFGILRYADFIEDAELIRGLSDKAGEWMDYNRITL